MGAFTKPIRSPWTDEFRRLLATWKDPEARASAYTRLAHNAAQNGEFAKSLADADSANVFRPEYPFAREARAHVKNYMGNLADMEADCWKCAEPEDIRQRGHEMWGTCNSPELSPESARADRERSNVFYLMGRLDEALEAIDGGLEKVPGDFYLHIWKAKVLLSLGRYCGEAEAEMTRAQTLTTEISPSMKWCLTWHDMTYVANLSPEMMHLSESLTMAYQANGQRIQARRTYLRGVERMHETFPEAALIKLMRDVAARAVGVDLQDPVGSLQSNIRSTTR